MDLHAEIMNLQPNSTETRLDTKLAYLIGFKEARHAAAELAAGVPTLTKRQKLVIQFALLRFVSDARWQLTDAAQDRMGRRYPAGAVEAFGKDAQEGEELLALLKAKE